MSQAAKLREAETEVEAARRRNRKLIDMERQVLVGKLQVARRHDSRQIMIRQWEQAMVGPQWEADDYEWCAPLFLLPPSNICMIIRSATHMQWI